VSQLFERAESAVKLTSNFELRGSVKDVTGLVVEGNGPFLPVGSQVVIQSGVKTVPAQVVGFKSDRVLLMPFGQLEGVSRGATIRAHDGESEFLVSDGLMGRIIDGLGNPIDDKLLPAGGELVPLYAEPPNPVSRKRVSNYFDLGVRSINTLLTMGEGQRMGIMAGSGVGKSTLMGMVAKHSSSDVNVIALVGERGREVREFIERDLGEEGLKRSIVVVATGNESALIRIRAAFLATAIAEHFRDKGKKVVLMLDSVTRLAMAQREIGLAIGEPPSTRGYTPSVFSMLPKLLERAGTSAGEGSITALYTVLVEGDDMNEPVADAVRGILDGHIILTRELASRGHFPAIDILQSTSRVMTDIIPEEMLEFSTQTREILATFKEAEDLITIGAYKAGQNPKVDRAVALIDSLNSFLKQKSTSKSSFEDSWKELAGIYAAEQAQSAQ